MVSGKTVPLARPINESDNRRPDHCDGSFDAYCDSHRKYTNITSILTSFGATNLLNTMNRYWKDYQGDDSNLWIHEWEKHGTCVSTLEPDCYGPEYKPQEEVVDYFRSAVAVYQQLPTYDWLKEAGIVPSNTQTYTRDQIMTVLRQKHGADVSLGCRGNKFDEVWYHFDVRGSIQTGEFVASVPDGGKTTCPLSGIRYPPKGPSGGGPGHHTTNHLTHTAPAGPRPTSTLPAFSGRGTLNVLTTDDRSRGCIIGSGAWYVSGTCAKFTSTPIDEDIGAKTFSLRSNKGECAVLDGELTCSKSIRKPSVFSADEAGLLAFGNDVTFFAHAIPRGWKQEGVYTEPAGHNTRLRIKWVGA